MKQRRTKKLLSICADKRIQAYLDGGTKVPDGESFGPITEWLRGIAQDLDSYLFVKQLWQQCLTYARYHAKAGEGKSDASPGQG